MIHYRGNIRISGTQEIVYSKWYSCHNDIPKAVCVIVHGMAEHSFRYVRFAEALTEQGFAVYSHDLPGHGRSVAYSGVTGHFADENGWSVCLEILKNFILKVQKENPGLPLLIIGHSMGSLLVRSLLAVEEIKPAAVVISGTSHPPGILVSFGKMLASHQVRRNGAQYKNKLLNKLSFENFNKRFSRGKTDFDFLSRDEAEVEKYVDDPFCGFHCTAAFYYDLFSGFALIRSHSPLEKLDKTTPVLILSGLNDAVGGFGKQVKKVISQLQHSGFSKVSVKLYPEGRHEMLNETNREEVTQDILEWIRCEMNI
ncbi:MAG: lysophospholipase [Bacteroidetes bacterium]|nr:lysophospholipase [Bacteroidota bacterium]MBU1719000.1 lysophospholipase [Bacteroidota bacterium]